jgi:hypothetical protein
MDWGNAACHAHCCSLALYIGEKVRKDVRLAEAKLEVRHNTLGARSSSTMYRVARLFSLGGDEIGPSPAAAVLRRPPIQPATPVCMAIGTWTSPS